MNKQWMNTMERSMQAAPMPYGLIDPDTQTLCFSNAALEQLLQRHSLSSGQTVAQCKAQLQPTVAHCMATASAQTHHWEASQTTLHLVPVHEDGRLLGIQCFAQQDAHTQVQRLHDALHTLPVGLWFARPGGEIYWANRANSFYREDRDLEAYLSSSQWVGDIHPDDLPRCAASFAKAVLNGKVEPYEMRIQVADGSMHWFHVDGSPVYNADGSIDRWVGIVQDIQAFKDKKAQLQAQIAQLQDQVQTQAQQLADVHAELSRVQKMELLGQLAGSVAHDFNNLLFVIRLNAGMLSRLSQDPKVIECVELIQQDIARATRTASELMTFSGRQPQQPQTYALPKLMASLEGLLRRAVGAEVDFQITLAPDLAPVHVDKTYFENALLNLCVNARDAVAGRGQVQLRMANCPHPEALDASQPPQPLVRIDISDNGCGMSAETIARVLEPFFTTKEVGSGTGLGLPMVERFVQQAGGFMRITSTEGAGTTFSLYLPQSQQREVLTTDVRVQAQSGSENILLIEDDLAVRNAVARLLIDMGYAVSTAYSPEVALEYLRTGLAPDMILSDMRMPGRITVMEMVHTLEAEGLLPPILFMTGYTPEAVSAEGLIDGRFPVIYKPVSAAELTLHVRATLDAGQPQAQGADRQRAAPTSSAPA